jgi:7-carboxy-7-deazaguanine synthase
MSRTVVAAQEQRDPGMTKNVATTVIVSEIYRSLQGESTRAGLPCTLVRLAGCGLRCTYCDTAYAFHGGEPMSVPQIAAQVKALGSDLVLLTGGEPLEQTGAAELIRALAAEAETVMVETGGHVDIGVAAAATTVVLDIKTPGSGMAQRNRWRNLDLLRPSDEIKFVLTSRADYEWAREVVAERRLTGLCPILFSPVEDTLKPADLAGWILEDRLPVRLNLQLHRYLWPAADRGV